QMLGVIAEGDGARSAARQADTLAARALTLGEADGDGERELKGDLRRLALFASGRAGAPARVLERAREIDALAALDHLIAEGLRDARVTFARLFRRRDAPGEAIPAPRLETPEHAELLARPDSLQIDEALDREDLYTGKIGALRDRDVAKMHHILAELEIPSVDD